MFRQKVGRLGDTTERNLEFLRVTHRFLWFGLFVVQTKVRFPFGIWPNVTSERMKPKDNDGKDNRIKKQKIQRNRT